MVRRRRRRIDRPRRLKGRGALNAVLIGLKSHRLGDLYYAFLETRWGTALALLAATFVAVNVVFALFYLGCGDCVEGARSGNFLDAFFFSVQTIATIGFGRMAPRTVPANVLVSVEAFTGLLGIAIVTGLVFSKFSRPTARVMFSNVAVIGMRNGRPCLMFRMANERSNRIVEAQVRVSLARNEITQEGERLRRPHDLTLERDRNVIFALSWTVSHPITESSPLHGATHESLTAERAEIVVSVTGLDETFAQTIYARHSYRAADIIPDARFVDIFTPLADGTPQIDYRHFHDWTPIESKREDRKKRTG
jgi:inward rectifier potassium channel